MNAIFKTLLKTLLQAFIIKQLLVLLGLDDEVAALLEGLFEDKATDGDVSGGDVVTE